MLKLENINVSFPNFELKNISLDINKGDYQVLLGPSGSGKTLILKLISGLQKVTSGRIIYKDKDITNLASNKRNISFLFQDLALFPHYNVEKNVEYPLKIRKISRQVRKELIDEYLELTGIKHLKNRNIEDLSGGEKQRVALSRSLVSGSDILLLDEPFSAIDSQLVISLKKLLKKISARGITIIHVTHNFEEAINMAHKILVLENGEVLQSATPQEILQNPRHEFTAIFSGHKNYFKCEKLVFEGNSSYALIKPVDSSALKTYPSLHENLGIYKHGKMLYNDYIAIESPRSDAEKIHGIIIDSKSIVISEEKLVSSARNSFSGVVTNIFPSKDTIDVEVFIGIHLWISITKQSYEDFDIKIDKMLYLTFKANNVIIV